jgi:hypothetical protein
MRFETTEQARNAGLLTVGDVRRVVANSGLQVVDTSGGASYGYTYGIAPLDDAEAIIVRGVTVSLTQEKNKLGQPGSVTTMFRAAHVDDAVARYPDPPAARCNMCGTELSYALHANNLTDCHRCDECWREVDAMPERQTQG